MRLSGEWRWDWRAVFAEVGGELEPVDVSVRALSV